MSQKIYMVTSGCYSDYHIDGVFSTRELAEDFLKKVQDIDKNVETWLLDGRTSWLDRTYWGCTLYVKSGRVDLIYSNYTGKSNASEFAPPEVRTRSITHTYDVKNGYDFLEVTSYRSYKHAYKVAVETRQEILRMRTLQPAFKYPDVLAEHLKDET